MGLVSKILKTGLRVGSLAAILAISNDKEAVYVIDTTGDDYSNPKVTVQAEPDLSDETYRMTLNRPMPTVADILSPNYVEIERCNTSSVVPKLYFAGDLDERDKARSIERLEVIPDPMQAVVNEWQEQHNVGYNTVLTVASRAVAHGGSGPVINDVIIQSEHHAQKVKLTKEEYDALPNLIRQLIDKNNGSPAMVIGDRGTIWEFLNAKGDPGAVGIAIEYLRSAFLFQGAELHEWAHLFDFATGISKTEGFKQLFKEEKDNLDRRISEIETMKFESDEEVWRLMEIAISENRSVPYDASKVPLVDLKNQGRKISYIVQGHGTPFVLYPGSIRFVDETWIAMKDDLFDMVTSSMKSSPNVKVIYIGNQKDHGFESEVEYFATRFDEFYNGRKDIEQKYLRDQYPKTWKFFKELDKKYRDLCPNEKFVMLSNGQLIPLKERKAESVPPEPIPVMDDGGFNYSKPKDSMKYLGNSKDQQFYEKHTYPVNPPTKLGINKR